MSDDSVRLDEDGAQTDGGVKRAGRARICKQCKFTTTDVREFSNHRLYAHAEENTEEKSVINRKPGSKRRSSATVSALPDDQKNKGTSLCETVEEVKKTEEVFNETKEVESQKNSEVDTLLLEKNSIDTQNTVSPEKNSMDTQITKTLPMLKVEKKDIVTKTETKPDLHNTEREKKMDNERISDELLDSLALAPKKISRGGEIRNGEKNIEMLKRSTAEKITIEKQNGMTEEVLLIKREDEPDDEPRLVIADDGSDIMDHSGLEPNSLFRTGNIQNRTYLCNLCEYSTTNAKSYLHHQKDIHHPEIIIYECDICDYATKYKQKLPRHRKLHFSGKDGFIESDLDSSLTERELREMKENASFNADFVNGEEEMDDEADIEDDEEEEIAAALTGVSAGMANQMNGGAPVEKKKRIRQEVDPLKYFEVMDENGVKYACSKCGNVYKWRKSLNKHWKEKHFGEVPDLTKPPPTLQNYTLFSRYKPKAGGQPPPPAAPNVVYGAAIPSPTNQSKSRVTPTNKSEEDAKRLSSMVMPRQIGPFISSSSPEFFHNQLLTLATQGSRMPENHHEMRRMIDELQKRSNALKSRKLPQTDRSSPFQENSQNEPIDYSKPLDFSKKSDTKHEVKSEPNWGDNNSESADSLQEMPISMSQANSQIALAMKQSIPSGGDADNPVLQCSKCSFVAKTLVDYSAHMSLHLNKRAFKCAECQSHFNGVEELNKHFLDNHSEKIQEHKEAIQKIPHGLQQTYHLLKMPLDSISNLSTQELLSNEPKQLKCSMCNFVAKWPAELQKHAVSHSEERPFVCMVCGSTYKWKWDLVKHFEKSHNSLPNPYKRREGGIPQTGTASPSTPPLESISRAASALMDENMAIGNYTMDYETPPLKKRRLSETEFQDTDDFYRELLERQIKHRREMAHSSDFLQIPNRPHSASSNKNSDSGKEDHPSTDSMDSFTQKHLVAEALKHRIKTGKQFEEELPKEPSKGGKNGSDVALPYKCSVCDYRARWPSEISQHMKNHSTEKPFHCPRCSYKSKWKWDVVKHLRRCGGGTVHDVIDTSKMKKMAPPNVMVLPQGNMHQPQIQQNQKLSPGQALYPVNQRPNSLSPAISNLSRLSNTNFSVAAGGQDHQAMMDLLSQNGHAVKSQNGKQNFNGFENDGLFHCLECPFVGNSHAELKRHAVLHSENKPFSCNMCGYSSRWKCDLKKHMKVYNHFDAPNTSESSEDMEIPKEKFVELEEDSDEEKSTLYMCPQCPYNSYKKSAYDHHLRIHGNLITPDNDIEPLPTQKKESSPKFKCTKCHYQGNDLSSFLQHKRSHGNQASTATEGQESMSPARSESRSLSPAPNEVSNRTLHLKHRRKPVKQFHCNRCPYICFKRSALINHENLHQSQGNDAYLCMFCDYNVFSKNLLLQHMRLHPEYNPAEGSEQDNRVSAAELMEMEELEEKELASDDRKEASMPEENNNIDEYESGFSFMSSQSMQNERTSAPSNLQSSPEKRLENNNFKESCNDNINGGGLPCEWCSLTFPNVVTLYQHAQSLHPTQLKAQEAGDIAAKQAPSKASQLANIVKERQREYQVYHQTLVHQPKVQQQYGLTLSQLQQSQSGKKLIPLAPKPQVTGQSLISGQVVGLDEEMALSKQHIAALNARKSASQQKRGRSFQCTKCSFTAPNAVTYLRHIERHGSNSKHTCLYCDYSIDRLNLLYQHMKGTHGTKWSGTTEEKIYLSLGTEDSNNNIIDMLPMLEENMAGDELNVSFNSSTNDPLEGYAEMNQKENKDDCYSQPKDDYFKMEVDINGCEEQFENEELMSISNPEPKPILQLKGNTIFKGVVIQVCSIDGKKNYKCPRCVYVNNNAANTANHVKQHGQQKKYKCKHCDYSVDNYKHIQHHMETVHPKKTDFVISSSQTDIPEEVDYSETGNYPEMTHECSSTNFRDKNRANTSEIDMDEEEIVEMPDTSTNVKDKNLANASDKDGLRFRCSCCPYFTNKKNAILEHRLNHIKTFALSCQLCTFSSNDNLELQQHLQFHHFQCDDNYSHSQDVTLDPYNDSFRIIEQLPNDIDDTEMEKGGDIEEDEALAETAENTDEFEEDPEVMMMEQELRETYGQLPNRVGMNLNSEDALENDIQFRTFKCKLCPYSSNSNAEFKKHCRLHGSKYKFKCDYCDYSLDRVNLISQHRKLHFRESDFDATPLMKTLLNKDHGDYENMLAKVGEDIAFPPSESGSKSVEDMLELNSYCQKNGFDDKVRYVCNKCPYRCQSLKSFKCHMQMHGLCRKYRCDYCDWSAERLNLLCQHRKVHASEPGFDPNPGDIRFLNREYVLDSEGNSERTVNNAPLELEDDPSLHSDFVNFQPEKNRDKKLHHCKICPFKTADQNSYSYHKKIHCIQAIYNCSECSYSINNITSLTEHIKLHKKEQEMLRSALTDGSIRQKCPKCPYNSPNKNMLVNHMAMHSSGRKYTCDQCDFSTDKQKLLELHLKVHEEGNSDNDLLEEEITQLLKRTPDVIGPKLYFSSTNLNDMESDSNDTAEMEHKCEKCPFSTPSKDELCNHVQHHDSQTKSSLNCTFCTFSCSKEDELLQHAQIHFPSTKLDWDMMKQLRKQHHSYRKNLLKSFPDFGDIKEINGKLSDENGEPDSTVHDNGKLDYTCDEKNETENNEGTRSMEKTKVYVCQFCEREFSCKTTMLQHEKQHLVGS